MSWKLAGETRPAKLDRKPETAGTRGEMERAVKEGPAAKAGPQSRSTVAGSTNPAGGGVVYKRCGTTNAEETLRANSGQTHRQHTPALLFSEQPIADQSYASEGASARQRTRAGLPVVSSLRAFHPLTALAQSASQRPPLPSRRLAWARLA